MKTAFIVGASENYLPGLKALINSIKVHNPESEIVLLSFRLPEEYLSTLNARIFRIEGDDQVRGTAIERFRVACEVINDYDAICLLDSDMFLLNDVSLFFEVASKGFIVTGSNGMVVNFDKAYQEYYELDLGKDYAPYLKIHTTVPIFINKDNIDWFEELNAHKRIDHWDDFLFLNMVGMKMEKDKKMICMPPYAFTGIHHWQLKPETSIFKKDEIVMTGTEEIVYMAHGKWWWEGWLQDLMPVMERYLHDEEMGPRCKMRVELAISILKQEFQKYLNM
jgi:hypothetical protein